MHEDDWEMKPNPSNVHDKCTNLCVGDSVIELQLGVKKYGLNYYTEKSGGYSFNSIAVQVKCRTMSQREDT